MPLVNGQFAMNPQVAQYKADTQGDGRVDADTAGYMELDGATKDGDCDVVNAGGVSGEKGCCNLFKPSQGAQAFSCGTCTHYKGGSAQTDETQAPASQSAVSQPPTT